MELPSVLALDFATHTGWCAIGLASDHIEGGMVDFSPKRGESPGIRYLRYEMWLRRMVSHHMPQVVAYELVYRHMGTSAAHVYGGFEALTQKLSATLQHELMAIPVQIIKRTGTGKGNAPKKAMIEAALKFRNQHSHVIAPGVNFRDDNIADALWVLFSAYERLELTRGWVTSALAERKERNERKHA